MWVSLGRNSFAYLDLTRMYKNKLKIRFRAQYFYEVLKTKLNKWKSNNHSVYLDEKCQLRSERADKKIFVHLDKPQINEFVFKNLPFFV